MGLEMAMRSFRDEVIESCRGKLWWVRAPLLVWCLVLLIRHLQDPLYQSIFKWLNLGIHELGHVLFHMFGEFLGILGGSLLQCLVPIVSMFMFYRQRDFFAIAFSFGWLATNLFDVATYIGDARRMQLELVSPFGGHVIHDWNYLLNRLGMLRYDTALTFLVRCGAVLSMLVCLVGGTWLLWQMYKVNKVKGGYSRDNSFGKNGI